MLSELIIYFTIYSFIGWLWECLISIIRDHKVINRGFLNGPYCPIYGCGALLFIALTKITDNPILIFFVGGLIACILEYITSYLMEKIFKARWWDYSNRKLNLNGRICFTGYIIFGIGAVTILYLHPLLAQEIQTIKAKDIIAIAIAAILILDILSTNQSFTRLNKILRDYQKALMKAPIAQFFEQQGKKFFGTVNNKRVRTFTWQQRRIIKAFPSFQTNYDHAYREMKKFYKSTKQKPIKSQKAHARKNAKKILK